MNKFNDFEMYRMIYLLPLSSNTDNTTRHISDTKIDKIPINSTNNKVKLEDYPIDLIDPNEILDELEYIGTILEVS